MLSLNSNKNTKGVLEMKNLLTHLRFGNKEKFDEEAVLELPTRSYTARDIVGFALEMNPNEVYYLPLEKQDVIAMTNHLWVSVLKELIGEKYGEMVYRNLTLGGSMETIGGTLELMLTNHVTAKLNAEKAIALSRLQPKLEVSSLAPKKQKLNPASLTQNQVDDFISQLKGEVVKKWVLGKEGHILVKMALSSYTYYLFKAQETNGVKTYKVSRTNSTQQVEKFGSKYGLEKIGV